MKQHSPRPRTPLAQHSSQKVGEAVVYDMQHRPERKRSWTVRWRVGKGTQAQTRQQSFANKKVASQFHQRMIKASARELFSLDGDGLPLSATSHLPGPSVEEALTQWEASYSSSNANVRAQIGSFSKTLREALSHSGVTQVNELTEHSMRSVAETMLEPSLAFSTQHQRLTRMRQFFTWAAQLDEVFFIQSPLVVLQGWRLHPSMSGQQVKRVLAMSKYWQAASPLLRASDEDGVVSQFLDFIVLSGMRVSEARGLKQKDVDLANKTIKIARSISATDNTEQPLKHRTPGTTRLIPLTPHLENLIRTKDGQEEAWLFSLNEGDSPIPAWAPNRLMRKALTGSPAEGATPLSLRSTWHSAMWNAGLPVSDVARLAGNSIAVAMSHYVESTESIQSLRDSVTSALEHIVPEQT